VCRDAKSKDLPYFSRNERYLMNNYCISFCNEEMT